MLKWETLQTYYRDKQEVREISRTRCEMEAGDALQVSVAVSNTTALTTDAMQNYY